MNLLSHSNCNPEKRRLLENIQNTQEPGRQTVSISIHRIKRAPFLETSFLCLIFPLNLIPR